MYRVLKGDLNSPTKFKAKLGKQLEILIKNNEELNNIRFESNAFIELLLSACRTNDLGIITIEQNKIFLSEEKILFWAKEKLIPILFT